MTKLIIGNWKMYPTLSDSLVLAAALKRGLEEVNGAEIAVAPPSPWLVPIHEHWKHKPKHLHLAAQNLWAEDQGAFTGEVSAYLLKDIVSYAIIGHSERRRFEHEDNDLITEKIHACLRWQITPVICIGEAKRTLFADGTVDATQWKALSEQLSSALEGLSKDRLEKVVIAYEPVWAISSTGNNPATPEYANQMIERLKAKVSEKYGQAPTATLRFIYGGSVDASNASDYLRYPSISGALVGSASVKAKEFLDICRQASAIR